VSAALLDVNVLIALLDPRHVDHERAHTWLADSEPLPWASCPLMENAVLPILGNPRYPKVPGLRPWWPRCLKAGEACRAIASSPIASAC
jgi:predicted nucleic acid-binding protein